MNLDPALFSTPLAARVAVLLDWVLGETRRFHPLVGFGLPANEAAWQRLATALNAWSTL